MTTSPFYERDPDAALRFGDVVGGFLVTAPHIDSPVFSTAPGEYTIDVAQPDYAVILTPCCSIGDKTLLLSPLTGISNTFFANPLLKRELFRLNYPMTPEEAVPPNVWENLSAEERARRLDTSKPASYALVENFVYSPHDLLPEYQVHRKDGTIRTGYYMIDFRRIHRVECNAIANPKQAPLEAKLAQISIEAREALRDKLAAYFARVPDEDRL